MNIRFTTPLVAALAAALSLFGCGGGDGGIGGTGATPMGSLQVSATDAPSCGYDAVNLTIAKVRVHQSASALDTDDGWSEIVLAPAKRIDLLALNNGLLEDLGETPLPAGKYTQLRLVLAANDAGHPLANSVLPSGGSETALTTPSAQQSGLKLNADIDVPVGKVVRFALDFDACKSIVPRGNGGQYNLKPVITVIPVLSDAGLRIQGYVDASIALGSTAISAQLNGVAVKSTPPDATGKFVLYPVPAGTYDLVVSASGHVAAVMTGVPVIAAAPTQVNTAAIPITPPTAAMRSVTGSVMPPSATVRALQTLTGGPSFEAAWGPVNATSGDFSLALPIGAPVQAGYVANPIALLFVADLLASSKFSLAATSNGTVQTQTIDVSGAVAPVTFTFP
ncbi:MAG TPA: DUF4382 domain-containing protein [Rhizobacter sp.]|nr:DUF4382 domain-containing protein [Rhizobacter sp.]